MRERRVFLRASVAAAAAWSASARAQPSDLEKLFALFAAQGERRKAFVERRHSVLFRNPPETRGTLYFKPPALLERDIVSPRRENVRIDAETVTLRTAGDDGRMVERTASLVAFPQLAGLVLTIRATLAGDLGTLRKMYRIALTQPLPRWRIELEPIDAPVAGAVSAITMAGERAEVERIQFTETTGDRTELLLTVAR